MEILTIWMNECIDPEKIIESLLMLQMLYNTFVGNAIDFISVVLSKSEVEIKELDYFFP